LDDYCALGAEQGHLEERHYPGNETFGAIAPLSQKSLQGKNTYP
jgi:hypothetical protein